jgi:hypothetical protein
VYGRYPKAAAVDWHTQLVTTYGAQRVAEAMHQALQAGATAADLLSRTAALLKPDQTAAADAAIDTAIERQRQRHRRDQEAADRDAAKVAAGLAAMRQQFGTHPQPEAVGGTQP